MSDGYKKLGWYAVYEDDRPNPQLIKDADRGSDLFEEFDAAEKAGVINGRNWWGMWIEDRLSEQRDVVRIAGHIPSTKLQIYNRWKERTGGRGQGP